MVLSGFRIAITLYPPHQQIRDWIDKTSPYPVTLDHLDIHWQGLTPVVSLSQVNMNIDPDTSFHIDDAHLHFHLGSLLQGQIKLKTADLHFQSNKKNETQWIGHLGRMSVFTSAMHPKTLEIDFKDLSLASPVTQSQITHVNGELRWYKQDKHKKEKTEPPREHPTVLGKLTLKSHQLMLQEPRLFTQPLVLKNCTSELVFQKNTDDWSMTAKSINATYGKTHIQGAFKAVFTTDSALPTIDSKIHMSAISIKDGLTLLPRKVMNPALTQWLESALLAGNITSTNMMLRGDLNNFPFDHHEGVFEIYSELEKVHLNYHPEWPDLMGLSANMLFRNRSMRIDGDSALYLGGIVEDVEAIIPDLTANDLQLTIDTKIRSTLENGKAVLAHSPLKHKIGSHLMPFHMEGPMDLSLGLVIPLGKESETEVKVRGLIGLEKAHFGFLDNTMAIEGLTGELQFSESHVLAQDLQGQLLGGKSLLSLSADFASPAPVIHVGSEGIINVAQLEKWQSIPLQPFAQGETLYKAKLDFSPTDKRQTHLSLLTTLTGVAIDAPNPFSKLSDENKPLKADIYFEPNDVMRLSAQYGEAISLAYSLQKGKKTKTLGGHLYLGEKQAAKFREDGIFLIDGDVKELNFDAWKHFFNHWKTTMGDSLDQASTVEPLVALSVEKMTINDLPFHHTKIEAEWQSDHEQWNIQCDGPSLSGRILLAKDKQKDLLIRLQKLVINTKETPNLSSLSVKPLPSLEQPIHATIVNCRINDIPLSQVTLSISSAPKGYLFDHFSATLPGGDVNLNGKWEVYNQNSWISMKGKMKLQNITDFLKALDNDGSINHAKGVIDFNLSWKGVPFKIDFPSVAGVVDLRLQKGSIKGMNSGLGRVLNLLNLDNIKRRLNLDFSDVTKSGFMFDDLTGRLQFGNGKVSSNDIMINGPAAKILGYGQADLITQGVRGQMTVMPNLTGSLPVAAALVVGTPFAGPLIGAAVWAADKIVGDKIQEIHRFQYQIAGTWQAPIVEEVQFSINPFTLLDW